MIGVVIPIYNRPDYVKQCFDSLKALTRYPDLIVLVDDASTDKKVSEVIHSVTDHFFDTQVRIEVIRNPQNAGVKQALTSGISKAIQYGSDVIINLDSDAIVTPDFLEILLGLKERYPDRIISGFNAITDVNPVLEQEDDHCIKKHCNGINMCLDIEQYNKYMAPALTKPGNWDYNMSLHLEDENKHFVFASPSVVQHIGLISSMGHNKPDIAQDFKLLSLPSVTLFGIDAHDQKGILRAAAISQRNIRFGHTKIITERLFPGRTNNEGRQNYSAFIMKELVKYIATDHVLIIHADGYILNHKAWNNDWLKYDYIGATWGYKDNKNVGNGGFSLRSKRLHQILATDTTIKDLHPEDDKICRQYRKYLEAEYGILFAPEEVANIFSIEAYGSHAFSGGNMYTGQFGFHGHHVDFSEAGKYGVHSEILLNGRYEHRV